MFKALLPLFIALVTLSAQCYAKEPLIVRFSHNASPDSAKGRAAEYFRASVEARLNGRVRIDVYPWGELYTDKEELQALQLGAVDMIAPALTKLGALGVRDFEVFELPFLFDNLHQVRQIADGAIGKGMLAKLDPSGVEGLAFWDAGFKNFSSNKPIRKLEDFRGQKFRVLQSKVIDAQVRALGATPETLAITDMYRAFEGKLVDGTESTAAAFLDNRFYEGQRYLLRSGHGYFGYVVIANKKFWRELPNALRLPLEEALRDATIFGNALAAQENLDALTALRTHSRLQIRDFGAAERKAMRAALLLVHQSQTARIGPDLIAAIYKEIGFSPAHP